MKLPLKQYLITSNATIRGALKCINRNASLAIVVDERRRRIGTITDGDVRRAVLAGASLEAPVQKLLDQRDKTLYPKPVTAPVGTPASEPAHIMNERGIRQIPLLDEDENVVDIICSADKIKVAICTALSGEFRDALVDLVNPCGDGHVAQRVESVLSKTDFVSKPSVKRLADD
jgi:CBS domain-containing protein